MKRVLAGLIVGTLLMVMAGCSTFFPVPKMIRINVAGLNSQPKEYVILLDRMPDDDLDIPLSKRDALKFDLQWMWNNDDALYYQKERGEDSQVPPLVPWMTYKYRF